MKNILVFSDFACPFSYVGFSIAEKMHREIPDINFQFIPYILNPQERTEGSDLGKFISEEEIEIGFNRVESLGREYDLKYENKRRKFNTNRLHLASLYAQDQNKFFEFGQLAFQYVFEFGKNVGLDETINEIAEKVGLNVEEMNEKINSGYFNKAMTEAKSLISEYSVSSVPTFVVDGVKKDTTLKDYDNFVAELL